MLDIAVRLKNPYWDKTKGEMLEQCADREFLRSCLRDSSSCSSPSKSRWLKKPPGTQCGYCVPCLIRRAAIVHAFDKDPTEYLTADLSARDLNSKQAEGEATRSFQYAAYRLRQNPDLASVLVHKPGPLDDVLGLLPELAGVYARGLAEVDALLSEVAARPL